MTINIRSFTNAFLDRITPGHRVLDLGAGDGKFAHMFSECGAIVTVVDTQAPKFQDAKITVKKMKIEDFCAINGTGHYDLIFARNVIQFLDKNWVFETLFPWMDRHSTQQGIIAIETFYQDPKPPFKHFMRSLYTLQELTEYFIMWKELYTKEYSHNGLDISGQTRKFFVSSLIVQKK